MAAPNALIAGANGQIGRAVVRHLLAQGWSVTVMSRGAASPMLQVVLTDPADCRRNLAVPTGLSHIIYAARYDHIGGQAKLADINAAMVANVLDVVEPVAPGLTHVDLSVASIRSGCRRTTRSSSHTDRNRSRHPRRARPLVHPQAHSRARQPVGLAARPVVCSVFVSNPWRRVMAAHVAYGQGRRLRELMKDSAKAVSSGRTLWSISIYVRGRFGRKAVNSAWHGNYNFRVGLCRCLSGCWFVRRARGLNRMNRTNTERRDQKNHSQGNVETMTEQKVMPVAANAGGLMYLSGWRIDDAAGHELSLGAV